jgi:hypothetical protein
MRHHPISRPRRQLVLPALVLLAAGLAWRPVDAGSAGLRVLIVGGGPEPRYNQIAIERHAAYVTRLLPAGTPRYTLFADGDTKAKTVLYEEEPKVLPPGERAFALLFQSREDASPTVQRFRAPQLGRLDGPARRAAVAGGFEWLRRSGPDRALLYFTGHGSQPRNGDLDNSVFDLWGERLPVRDLAAHLATLPPRTAVTLVMVQCYSGAFGNLIFAGGDPAAGLAEREIAGFFSAPRERMAAGCTPELNEANYRDFSSYFFAALTGRDRVGRKVSGADYNRDGRVGMNEAFAYTLAHDASIDVPVCTSDVLLRWAVPMANEEVFPIPYSKVRSWATPAQAAALQELSRALQLTGETRPADAYRMLVEGSRRRAGPAMAQARRQFRAARDEARTPLLSRWPELERRFARGRRPRAAEESPGDASSHLHHEGSEGVGAGAPSAPTPGPSGSGYTTARAEAVAELGRLAEDGGLKELFDAEAALSRAEEQQMEAEIEEARVLRFVRLVKSIVLAHHLRASGDPAVRKRFERLLQAEGRPLLPSPAGPAPRASR